MRLAARYCLQGFAQSLEMMNIVGAKVREARYRGGRKVSQADLAARIQALGFGLDRTAISKIENGHRTVKDVELQALCQALGVTVASLFDES